MKRAIAIILLGLMLVGCSHTKAERITYTYDKDGSERIVKKTTLELSRLDSKACFGEDCIQTRNASWFDRVWKIPQLILFQMGPGGAATD